MYISASSSVFWHGTKKFVNEVRYPATNTYFSQGSQKFKMFFEGVLFCSCIEDHRGQIWSIQKGQIKPKADWHAVESPTN